jgi:hypothetical protein
MFPLALLGGHESEHVATNQGSSKAGSGRRDRSSQKSMKLHSTFITISVVAALLPVGCANNRSAPSNAGTSHGSRLTTYLSTLRMGMTPEDAEQELKRLGCLPVGTLGLARSHRHSYVFLPDAATVTLQYDRNNRLVSWSGAAGSHEHSPQ